MICKDTIAAIATSSKDGNISVIRVSGSHSCDIVSKIFVNGNRDAIDLTGCTTHTIQYGFICNGQKEVIDEVLVLVMKEPRSYTMEDVVEIQCHGGYMICQTILDLLIENGTRIAEPGEFTKRAFFNGRIDLSQAESVMDVIQAKSKAALKNSMNQLKGDVRKKIISLREMILQDIAFLEAALDDPEHISLDGFPAMMKEHTCHLRGEVNHLLENSQNGRIIKEGVKTAIVGKPNVGKSSFLNCILREERAIVTDIPGTTRDTLEEELRIGSVFLHLIDTAGIRQTEDAIENIGIEKAKRAIGEADFIICIVDASRELGEEDFYVLEQAKNCPGVILFNKYDLHVIAERQKLSKYDNKKIIPFSALTGEGLDQLENYVNELFLLDKMNYNDEIYITNARQREALVETSESLKQLGQSIDEGMPEDLYSIDLYSAYEALGKIIGETVEDDIIDKIFKEFCMGK